MQVHVPPQVLTGMAALGGVGRWRRSDIISIEQQQLKKWSVLAWFNTKNKLNRSRLIYWLLQIRPPHLLLFYLPSSPRKNNSHGIPLKFKKRVTKSFHQTLSLRHSVQFLEGGEGVKEDRFAEFFLTGDIFHCCSLPEINKRRKESPPLSNKTRIT